MSAVNREHPVYGDERPPAADLAPTPPPTGRATGDLVDAFHRALEAGHRIGAQLGRTDR